MMSALGFGIWIWVDMWQDDIIMIKLKKSKFYPIAKWHHRSQLFWARSHPTPCDNCHLDVHYSSWPVCLFPCVNAGSRANCQPAVPFLAPLIIRIWAVGRMTMSPMTLGPGMSSICHCGFWDVISILPQLQSASTNVWFMLAFLYAPSGAPPQIRISTFLKLLAQWL